MSIAKRVAASALTLTLSLAGLKAWVDSEDVKTEAYIPTQNDVPTIAAGATVYEDNKPVKMGDKVTPKRAVLMLLHDANKFSKGVGKCLGETPVTQYEFDALVHFSKNVGIGAFCTSMVAKKMKAGDYEGACDNIRAWRFYKTGFKDGKPVYLDCSTPNKICSGLWTDRQETIKWCKGESNKYWKPD